MATNASPTPAPAILSGLHEIAANYDVVFCDVWGVVHNGRQHFTDACGALARYRSEFGGVVILVTNAPRPHASVRQQLARLSVPADVYDDIVTSGDVTLALIAAHGNAPLHHIGPARDSALFDILESQTGFAPPRVNLDAADYVVCTGLFNDETEQPGDYDAALGRMRARGLELISANPDHVVHVGDKLVYCSGAIADRYASLGGVVLQAGKPYAPIYERAMQLGQQRRGGALEKSRVLAIGDGMHTDVKGGCDFGLDVLFVTGGIHQADFDGSRANDASLQRFLQNAENRPKAALDVLRW